MPHPPHTCKFNMAFSCVDVDKARKAIEFLSSLQGRTASSSSPGTSSEAQTLPQDRASSSSSSFVGIVESGNNGACISSLVGPICILHLASTLDMMSSETQLKTKPKPN